jgi:hypothetical protein
MGRVLAISILGALVACSGISVNQDFAPGIDFQSYQTYAWMPNQGATRGSNDLADQRIRSAVEGQLRAKGFRPAPSGDPDFYVGYHLILDEEVDYTTYNDYWGPGQIVKGWLNADGTTEERVYDVALSDGRTDGSVAVGNTVDLATGEYTNDIGDPELVTFWEDPDFDPEQSAFYYARVLQIPTPRYSLLDAIEMGIDVGETERPATIQERVYTSPIWYTPGN